MEAKDFLKISESITNRESLEILYNQMLVPAMMLQAECKKKFIEITFDQLPGTISEDNAKERTALGFNKHLQRLVEEDMRPLLEEKGFKIITCSPSYFVKISWG